jgi:quinol monooxygenase YgiN
MRGLKSLLLGFALLSLAAAPYAQAEVKLRDGTVLSEKPYFIVTYIEAAPDDAAKVEALIKGHATASAKEKGNLRFEGLRRSGQKNHFVILETWTDKDARDAHAKAAHTVKFRKDLQPSLYNPYDERPSVALVAAEPAKIKKGSRATAYVVTHVDIIPPEQFPPCKRQVDEKGPCGNAMVEKLAADSRKHKGMMRFDVLTQANRPNHMTIVEMWTSSKAQKAHTVSADVRNFRDALSGIKPGSGVNPDALFVLNPLTGSLYDERLYRLIR